MKHTKIFSSLLILILAVFSNLNFNLNLAVAETYDDLISAAKMGHSKQLAEYINNGASVNSTDIEGNTLLM